MITKHKLDAYKIFILHCTANQTFIFIRFSDTQNYNIKIQIAHRNQVPLKSILITPPNISRCLTVHMLRKQNVKNMFMWDFQKNG